MTENPFHPPKSEPKKDKRIRFRKVWIPGGASTITTLAIIAGSLIAGVMWPNGGTAEIFGIPLLCMFCVSMYCVSIMRGLQLNAAAKVGIILTTTLASYVIFFPICLGGGLLSTMAGFQQQYGPDQKGLYFACILAATLSLNFVFWLCLTLIDRKTKENQQHRDCQDDQ